MATKIFLLFFVTGCLFTFSTNAQNSTSESTQLLTYAEKLIRADSALVAVEVLEPLIKSKNPKITIKALRLTGLAYLAERETRTAEGFLHQAVSLSRMIFNMHEEAHSLFLLARAKVQINSFNEAKSLAQKARAIIRQNGDKDLELQMQNFLMWMYFETNESFYSILDEETKTFQLVNQVGTEMQKALVYNNLGYDLTVAGTVPIDSAISLMEFANSTYARVEETEGRWYTLMNLTWQHRLKNGLEVSKRYGEKSLQQALNIEDRHAIVEAAFQLGETLIELEKIDEAEAYYETGLKWRGDQEDRDRYVFDVYYARYLWEMGEKERAISILESAVEWLTQSEVFYEMHGRALLASYYWELGQFDLAEEQLEILENTGGDYISLETRCLGAITRAKWFVENGQSHMAKALMESWLKHTQKIGAQLLVSAINNYL